MELCISVGGMVSEGRGEGRAQTIVLIEQQRQGGHRYP